MKGTFQLHLDEELEVQSQGQIRKSQFVGSFPTVCNDMKNGSTSYDVSSVLGSVKEPGSYILRDENESCSSI